MTKKLLILVLLLAPLTLSAQLKFGVFDYGEVMQSLPGYRTAYSELQALTKKYAEFEREMYENIQKQYNDYVQKRESMPEGMRERTENNLQQQQTNFQQAQQDNAADIQKQQAQKMQPLIQRVMEAVNNVASEGDYVYLLDRSAAQQAGIFINEKLSEDVTKKIQDKLGITAADIQAGKAFAAELQKESQQQQQPQQ